MRFHRYAIARWILGDALAPEERDRRKRVESFVAEELAIWRGTSPLANGRREIRREILFLTAGGESDAEAWYDQPTDRMFAQLQSAVQVALDFPNHYPSAYAFLTASPAASASDRQDAALWQSRSGRSDATIPGAPGLDGDVELAARTRLGNFVSRRIETLQAWSEWRSARSNQFLAFGVAAALVTAAACAGGAGFAASLLLGVLAGMTAPFAKDVVDRLAGVRWRR
jgi:hypothetical protein